MEDRNVVFVTIVAGSLATLKFLGALATKFIGDDLKAWLPVFVERIFERAIGLLDFEDRTFFRQKWQSRLDKIPGDLSKFIVVLICSLEAMWRSRHMNHIPSRFRRYGVTASVILAVAIFIPSSSSSDGDTSPAKLIDYVVYFGNALTNQGIAGIKRHADNPDNNSLGPALGRPPAGVTLITDPAVGHLFSAFRSDSQSNNTVVNIIIF
jgi:hypothetical protein